MLLMLLVTAFVMICCYTDKRRNVHFCSVVHALVMTELLFYQSSLRIRSSELVVFFLYLLAENLMLPLVVLDMTPQTHRTFLNHQQAWA